jgi:DNA-binding NtrC family response regulator
MGMNSEARAKILVIDDDVEIQDLLIAFFKPKGFEVFIRDDSQKVIDELSSKQIDPDVIICDLQLPNMTGIEFTRKTREMGIEIPILVITGTKTIETAIEAIDAGAYDFVVKPIHLQQLLVSVERALHFRNIKSENQTLRTAVQIKEGNYPEGIIGRSPGFKKVMDLARRVASSQANIFIGGESGTGKEVVARAIHNMGPRAKKEFVALNCASIPESLLESELFGYAKGSFTGAIDKRIGLFEEADGGTLFLDEIGDLSLPLQAKILRVLQERQIKRIGENKYRTIDVRILSATHRDLRKEVAEGRFREDLFFRLNVIEIKIPPLRDRKEDIMPLIDFFLKKFSVLNGIKVKGFSKESLEEIHSYSWPGNVRELENAVERAVILCGPDGLILPEDLPDFGFGYTKEASQSVTNPAKDPIYAEAGKTMTIDELVKKYIKFILEKNQGMKDKTAIELNIDRKTLYRKLKEMELERH